METIIKYFYNLKIDEFEDKSGYILLKANNNHYIFKEFKGKIDELKKIVHYLEINHIKYHKIVLNKDNDILTKYDSKEYILLELIPTNFLIDTNFFVITTEESTRDTINMWINMINNNELSTPFNNYYIGLTETAISLYNEALKMEGNLSYTISHHRIYFPNYSINYLDPTKMVIDIKGRDIAEYIKTSFFQNSINIDKAIELIERYELSDKEINILLSRLLYPSYYFDLADNKEKYLDYIEDYEVFIKELMFRLSKKHLLIEIDWLKKRTN